MENLKNEIKSAESAQDAILLYQSNTLQIRLAKDLGYELDEFINYFSYSFRRMFNNNLNKSCPLKTDWEKLYGTILTHFTRNNYSLKVKDIVEF